MRVDQTSEAGFPRPRWFVDREIVSNVGVLPVELPIIGPGDEARYLQLAYDNPNMSCSEAPPEILRDSSFSGEEPTPFILQFFSTGYNQWHLKARGFRLDFDPERLTRGAIVLWHRACALYTCLEYDRHHEDWDKEFFSDEGLYD